MQLYSQLLFLQNKGLMECLRPEMHSKLELVSFSLALPSIKKVNCIALTNKKMLATQTFMPLTRRATPPQAEGDAMEVPFMSMRD